MEARGEFSGHRSGDVRVLTGRLASVVSVLPLGPGVSGPEEDAERKRKTHVDSEFIHCIRVLTRFCVETRAVDSLRRGSPPGTQSNTDALGDTNLMHAFCLLMLFSKSSDCIACVCLMLLLVVHALIPLVVISQEHPFRINQGLQL